MKLMVNEIGEQLSHENNKDNILILMATLMLLAHFYGFTLDKKYEKTIKNYFVDNYDDEIFDGDLQCVDMYYYSNDLKKAKKEM